MDSRCFVTGPHLPGGAEGLVRADTIAFVGHGGVGPLGPGVGGLVIRDIQQLPLVGSRWGICLACSSGDSISDDHVRWTATTRTVQPSNF